MTKLTTEQLDYYKNKGYISPVYALTSTEAKEIRDEIEKIEKNWPKALEGINRNYVHLISPVFNKVCLNKNILDAVESIIGKNILICGTTLFIKNPKEIPNIQNNNLLSITNMKNAKKINPINEIVNIFFYTHNVF